MNHLSVGTPNSSRLIEAAGSHKFLLIDDGPIADAFLAEFPRAQLFDLTEHHFNPLKGIDHKQARDFADAIYSASPQGEHTLTVRNGKRALARLLRASKRLDKLHPEDQEPGTLEALATVDDLLFSPVVTTVLCNDNNFHFNRSVVVKLDRATLGDFDAFVLGTFLIGQTKGQVIVPDGVFYLRDQHISLIRQNRLILGAHTLSQLSPRLRSEALRMEEKHGEHCLPDDALTLAQYAGLIPGTVAHTEFVQRLIA